MSFPPWTYRVSNNPIPYPDALAVMDQKVEAIATHQHADHLWLLEHPPLYTTGTSVPDSAIPTTLPYPVYRTGRGGQITWHGAGQCIAYIMCNLVPRRRDVRAHVFRLEEIIIQTLAIFGVTGMRIDGRPGVWVTMPAGNPTGGVGKIAALGVRVRHWVTMHGFALNLDPDLGAFSHIIPCGITDSSVTSLAGLGIHPPRAAVHDAIVRACGRVMGVWLQNERS